MRWLVVVLISVSALRATDAWGQWNLWGSSGRPTEEDQAANFLGGWMPSFFGGKPQPAPGNRYWMPNLFGGTPQPTIENRYWTPSFLGGTPQPIPSCP